MLLRNLNMGQEIQVLVFVLVILLCEACETKRYGLDDPIHCSKIRIKWLEDDQCAIIVGKITAPQSPNSDKDCQFILGASSRSKYQFVLLTFDTFYINSCDVVLKISDSPTAQFDRKVKQLALLTCQSPNPGKIYSHEGNHVMLSLQREDKYIRNYNFRINASLSTGPPKPSKPIKTILIVIGLITAFILAGCGFLYKCYLMQRARWQESTSVLDVHEYSTPRVRHRFPGEYGSLLSYEPLCIIREVQNGRINSSSQTTFGDDAEPRVHIILQGMNGGTEAGPHSELDYPPPSYEEAISMPSQLPSRNQKQTPTAKSRNATERALAEEVEEVEEEEEASSSSTAATNSTAAAATTTATSTEAQLLHPNLSHSLFDS
ncbi:uncharacterized protein LOC106877240 isoform X3 [Octopus bimaculoides]|uniref:uncharacterized protein LOC106877240 isoform X3 n=1 Tax=Octopus bimaculoides TaxID=37653 RepID=UPI00071D899F|nr:uncharacterized protein LOC106877240 isoform X3 [Octopus bimaculoides]|eukprot:XP_014781619.1 PREDICTED: uncharacterized protein LOC106877240 isoform X3 [Octopus bimaculoides]